MIDIGDVRVLIAEDDYLVGEEIKRVLMKIGYIVIGIVSNGEQAISEAISQKPDIILMDIDMPKMGGLEATKKIQEICPTPIIMLTAYETRELVVKASELGVSGYLMKPPQSAKVERAITIALARHKEIMEISNLNTRLKSEIFQRKLAETQLRESEEHYRLLFDLLPYGGEVIDKTGIITECSPSTAKILGYNTEELIGMHVTKLLTTVSRKIFHEKFPFLLAGQSANAEIVMIRKDKTELNILRAANPIIDSDGKIKSILALNIDITKRKKVEQKMKQRDRYLTALNIAKKMLLSDSKNNIFQRYVEILGKVAKASRTYIFINSTNKNGELLMHQKAEYCAAGFTPQIDNADLLTVSYKDSCPRWENVLGKGEKISGIVKEFPISEREVLEPQDIKSILVAPIITDNKFLGFIGFDNCQNTKMWDDIEQTFLMNSANDLAEYLLRKKTKDRLKAELDRFQTILDTIDAVVYVADMQTYELIMLNKLGREITGGTTGGKCYNTLQNTTETPCTFCTNHLLLDENGLAKESYIWEFQNTITKQWYMCHDQAILWPDGRTVRLEIALDITKIKEMENQLHISKNFAENLLETANSLIINLDTKANIVSFNKYAEQMLGYKKEEVIGKNWIDIFIPEQEKKSLAMVFDGILKRLPKALRNRNSVIAKNGKRFMIDWSNNIITDTSGNDIGTLGVGIDIGEQEKAEKGIAQAREQLRTTNLILRHDITNDLNVMKSAIRIFERTHKKEMLNEVNSRIRKSLNTINAHRKRETFIDSFSGLNKYDLKRVIDKVIKLFPKMDIKIIGSGSVFADEAIYSVFENIISNAIMHGNTPKMNIELVEKDEYCEVSCIDFGSGINDDVKAKIFEKGFYHGDTGNTGMGLHIVRNTIQNYGGSVSVIDNDPQGTIIKISLKRYVG